MRQLTNIADILLGLTSLLAAGIIGLIGIAIFGFGVSGLVVGVHGGPITAGVMILFGSALLFIGYYGGRYGMKVIRHRDSAQENLR